MSTTERTPLTRDSITAAAREQVEEVGLYGLSLRAVARSLGVTGAALYKHVGSKHELVELVATDAFDDLARQFAAISAPDPIEKLREQSAVYVAFARSNPELYRVMMRFPPAAPATRSEGASGQGASEQGASEQGDERDSLARAPAFDPATEVFDAALIAVIEAVDAGLLAPMDPVIAALTLWAANHGVVDVLLMGLDLPDSVIDTLIGSTTDAALRGLMS